jgi:hypothetical protein
MSLIHSHASWGEIRKLKKLDNFAKISASAKSNDINCTYLISRGDRPAARASVRGRLYTYEFAYESASDFVRPRLNFS